MLAFIAERTVIVRILDHIDGPSRAPYMAPIRGAPETDAMQQLDDI